MTFKRRHRQSQKEDHTQKKERRQCLYGRQEERLQDTALGLRLPATVGGTPLASSYSRWPSVGSQLQSVAFCWLPDTVPGTPLVASLRNEGSRFANLAFIYKNETGKWPKGFSLELLFQKWPCESVLHLLPL